MARQMKDSGLEWIGEIPEEWTLKRLSSLFEDINKKVSDKDFRPLSVTKQGILPQIEGVAKTDNGDNRKLVQRGNFVINSRSDRKGSSGVSEYEGSVSLINIVFRAKSEVSMQYMHHLLRSFGFQEEFYRWGHGIVADLWTTNSTDARNILLPYPKIEEQSLIATTLDLKCAEIDKVIEQTRATIEEYKKLKQAIITEAVTKGLDSSVPMKDSGVEYLGCIPRGWSIISIGQAFVYVGGFAFKSELFTITESNYQVLRIGNVKNNNLILDNKQIYIDESCAETAKVAEVRTDDILFTMTGTKGKRDYFYTVRIEDGHIAEKRLFINQRVGLFRKKNKKIKMAFANYLLKEKRILDYIFLSETGTANQGNLGIETIARTKLYLPPLEEQEEICLYLDAKCAEIDRIIEKKEQLIEELGSYKKSLICEYVTGKKEIEIHKYS